MSGEAAAPRAPARRGLTRIQKIGLGLLSTLVGLALLSSLLPSAPERLGYVLPAAAVGLLLLWIGGILMGIGSRS